jgi:hypothetical protein
MHKSATKCNETIGKWCKNKHGASKIIDTFETYQPSRVRRTQEEISFLLSPPNLRGELKPMHQMQWQEHTKCSNPSLPNPTKATNATEGYERKNKEEIYKELQDLDPITSPLLEEKVIGENVDLDLLSHFP